MIQQKAAKEKIVDELVASEVQRQWFAKPLFGAIAYQDFINLHDIVQNRDGIKGSSAPNSPNYLAGLFALGQEILGNHSQKQLEQYDEWSAQLVEKIKQDKLYIHLSKKQGFKSATREFERLRAIKHSPAYASPFAQLQFIDCILTAWGHYAMLQSASVLPKRPLAKVRLSAKASAKKLNNFMSKHGVALPDVMKTIALKSALEELIVEMGKPRRAARADDYTNGRNAVRSFAKEYFSYFGHHSKAICVAFASIIGHSVANENIATQLQSREVKAAKYTPRMYPLRGGMENGENLPFPMVMVFGKK